MRLPGWRRNCGYRRVFAWLAVGVCPLAGGEVAIERAGAADAIPPIRFAISERLVVGVNANDARAAFKVWSREVLATGYTLVSEDYVLPSERLLEAVRRGTVDFLVLTVSEYRQVRKYLDAARIISDDRGGEELLLVVREGSGIERLADLRGRTLTIFESPATTLAEPWLAVSLWRDGLPSTARVLKQIAKNPKLSQVVLPVFFGQVDACLTTRRGLAAMAELNPQVSKKLKTLLASPPLVAALFVCRKGLPDHMKTRIINRLIELKSSTTTRQILTLFQAGSYMAWDENHLLTTILLLETYDRRAAAEAGGGR